MSARTRSARAVGIGWLLALLFVGPTLAQLACSESPTGQFQCGGSVIGGDQNLFDQPNFVRILDNDDPDVTIPAAPTGKSEWIDVDKTSVEDWRLRFHDSSGGAISLPADELCWATGTNECLTSEVPLANLAAYGDPCAANQSVARNGGDSANVCITPLTAEVDGSTTNEVNTIAADSGGNTTGLAVTLTGAGIVTTSRAGDVITITGTEVDGSTSNELQNLFATIDPSSGTNPVADSTTDTLSINATAPLVATGDSSLDSITFTLTQHAGTDVTADLEEETHATEHSLGGSDAITVTNLASGCSDAQVLGGTSGGTGVECQSDVDTNASTLCSGTTTYLDGEGNCDDISSAYSATGHTHTGSTLSGIDVSDDLNLAATPPLVLTGDTLSCNAASGSQPGCLGSADWTTFNDKQAGPLTGDVTTSGAAATIALNAVALATDTTGAFVADITAAAGLTASGGGGENATVTLATASTEAGFLTDGGSTSLTCSTSNQGKMQVLDSGALEWCDGAGTSVLRSTADLSPTSHTHTTSTVSGLDVSDDLNLGATAPLVLTGDTLSCVVATGSVAGCLAAADWTTFNGKQAGPLTGDVTTSGAAATIAANAVALGTDTTGPYVNAATASGGLVMTGSDDGTTLGVLLPAATNALSATTSSGSGLQVLAAGLTLLQGCADGEILKWVESTDTWDCAADGGTAPAFSAIASGTNTTAAMVVGTGASLGTSGSGTIAATDLACTGCVATTEVASGVTLDTEWDTAAEINAASSDDDFVTLTGAQTLSSGAKTINSLFNFSGGTLRLPNSATAMTTCAVGDVKQDSDAAAGSRLHLCIATDTSVSIDNPFGAEIGPTEMAQTFTATSSFSLDFDTNNAALILPRTTSDPALAGSTVIDEGGAGMQFFDTALRTVVDNANTVSIAGAKTFTDPLTVAETTTATSGTVSSFSSTLTSDHASGTVTRYGAEITGTTSSGAATTLILSGLSSVGNSASSTGTTLLSGGVFQAIKSGTGAVATAYGGQFSVSNTNATAAISTGAGVRVSDGTATGAITLLIGVDIAAQTAGTSNIGIRTVSPIVMTPPTAQAIAAVGNTITCSGSVRTFTTFTGTNTLTSSPTIADGQSGQLCILMNTDGTATDCITITDGASTGVQLEAGANLTLCPGDNATFIYNGTDWIEQGRREGII